MIVFEINDPKDNIYFFFFQKLARENFVEPGSHIFSLSNLFFLCVDFEVNSQINFVIK